MRAETKLVYGDETQFGKRSGCVTRMPIGAQGGLADPDGLAPLRHTPAGTAIAVAGREPLWAPGPADPDQAEPRTAMAATSGRRSRLPRVASASPRRCRRGRRRASRSAAVRGPGSKGPERCGETPTPVGAGTRSCLGRPSAGASPTKTTRLRRAAGEVFSALPSP